MSMQFSMYDEPRHIIPISGKDSLATALFMKAKEPNIDFEYMFNPTGAELPEVFEWIRKVELYLKRTIYFIGEDLEKIIEGYGYFLPSRINRYCTKESKIQPMETFLGKSPSFVYYGIRSDEDRMGYKNYGKANITPVYPLKEAGIDLKGVYAIVHAAGLKPPTFFWQRLYERVKEIAGTAIVEKLSEFEKDVLFSWRTRANCYFCFNQRKYEWAGLLEHHPLLFERAKKMEVSGSDYYWNGKDYPLEKIIENADAILERRAQKIAKYLIKKKMETSEDDAQFIDILSVTSCGLLCGK